MPRNKSTIMTNKDWGLLDTWDTKLRKSLKDIDISKPFQSSVTARCLGHVQQLKSARTLSEFNHAYQLTQSDCKRLLEIKSSNQDVNLLLNEIKNLAEMTKNNVSSQEARTKTRPATAKNGTRPKVMTKDQASNRAKLFASIHKKPNERTTEHSPKTGASISKSK